MDPHQLVLVQGAEHRQEPHGRVGELLEDPLGVAVEGEVAPGVRADGRVEQLHAALAAEGAGVLPQLGEGVGQGLHEDHVARPPRGEALVVLRLGAQRVGADVEQRQPATGGHPVGQAAPDGADDVVLEVVGEGVCDVEVKLQPSPGGAVGHEGDARGAARAAGAAERGGALGQALPPGPPDDAEADGQADGQRLPCHRWAQGGAAALTGRLP
mmetsp:Transcript_36160/g.111291  ORF Transcript_36160/g.111291 Transcript_36160/m.111291 type:complete len:213 (+) Transcript_36160:397-1035(+)